MKHGKNMDSEDELFTILDQYMNLSPDELPTREEIEERYPALATEIWRCLEGMKLLKKEESSRQARLSAFITPENSDDTANFNNSRNLSSNLSENISENLSVTASCGGKKPDIMLGVEPIGDFELVREIARGGMGVVYEAWQNSLSRLVALKVLPLASTFDERQLQRFRNEAAAAAQLDHPGIVPIYAIGCDRGIHFYAMKLINGAHLGAVIGALRKENNEAETVPEAIHKTTVDSSRDVNLGMTRLYLDRRQEYFRSVARLMKQVADALEYARQCGVIHRDIKPANLMLDVEGRLWITDFGLAQACSDGHLTRTGEVFGTPRYMSPEQAQGHCRLADHRVDIYSLGATFYEFLTLHPIFSETNQVHLLKQITQDAPIKPHVWEPGIPRDLETILLKCIAKIPSERYETAGELAADLERFLENRPILARRPGILEIAAKWNYRHPWALTFVFLTLLAVWIGTVIHHQKILEEQSKTQVALAEAQARFEKARTAADTLVKIAEEELATDNAPKVRRARQKVLDTALVLYQDFLTIDELDPETERQLMAIRNYVQQFMELLAESNSLPPIFLLMNHDVQEDMALTSQQKEKIMEFHHEFGKRGELLFRDLRNFTQEERVNRLLTQIRATDAFLKDVLKPEQEKRLREIQLQMQPERIFDEDVREELNLTEEQVAELENAFSAPYFRPQHDYKARRGKNAGKMEMPPLPRRNEGDVPEWRGQSRDRTEILASILTEKQIQEWGKMQGKPFVARRFRHENGRGTRKNEGAKNTSFR